MAAAWTSVNEQTTVGPQGVQFVAMPGVPDDFRVVAEYLHGNRKVSAPR
jgi:hypothetical protein